MVNEEQVRRLDPERDAAALKALTHPLRTRLLGLLRIDGPATATELARRTGESSASTSYHLRVLAKYAFVAEAEHRDARERRWRAVHEVTAWSNTAMEAAPDSRAFLDVTRSVQLDNLARSVERHRRDLASGRLGPEWVEPSNLADRLAHLTPESVAELWEVIDRTVDALAARDEGDPRARQTVLFHAALPLAPHDPTAPHDPAPHDPGADEPGGAAS